MHVDPQTGASQYIKLPGDQAARHFLVLDDHLVYVTEGRPAVTIINSDLSNKQVVLDQRADHVMAAGSQQVVVLSHTPIEEHNQVYVDTSSVDIRSGKFSSQHQKLLGFALPNKMTPPATFIPHQKYLISIEGISRDLSTLYSLYFQGEQPAQVRLGAFRLSDGKELASTENPQLIQLASGYAQYGEMLYTSYSGDGYGSAAALIDMTTAASLLDFDQYPKWRTRRLIITPFGENLLLDRGSEVVLLSPSDRVLQTYPLPPELAGQPYRLLYYFK